MATSSINASEVARAQSRAHTCVACGLNGTPWLPHMSLQFSREDSTLDCVYTPSNYLSRLEQLRFVVALGSQVHLNIYPAMDDDVAPSEDLYQPEGLVEFCMRTLVQNFDALGGLPVYCHGQRTPSFLACSISATLALRR